MAIAFAADPFSTSHVRKRSAAFARHIGPQRVALAEVQRAALRIQRLLNGSA